MGRSWGERFSMISLTEHKVFFLNGLLSDRRVGKLFVKRVCIELFGVKTLRDTWSRAARLLQVGD
jgi:hypothetical protein